MTRVKMCGLTRRDDAVRAAELGADAVGFVFAPASRRRACPEVVARIVEELPPFVTAVGVFQDQTPVEVREIAHGCGFDLVQLHGEEDDAYISNLGYKALKALSVGRREDVERLAEFRSVDSFLLDARAGRAAGGTGTTFDWDLAVAAKRFGKIVLAGGLHPGNVARAVRWVRPWAVDCASGIEVAPGIKDPEKMRRFMNQVREADRVLEDEEAS